MSKKSRPMPGILNARTGHPIPFPPPPPPWPRAQKAPPSMQAAPSVSVIVPFRPGCPQRERLWDYLRSLYAAHHPSWDVVAADAPTETFSRAGAIYEGARRAKGDTLVVVDADVWCLDLEQAVSTLHASRALWLNPSSRVTRLNQTGTQRVLDGGRFIDVHPSAIEKTEPKVACGGCTVITRRAFDTCPPDRRFIGWGAEDNAWGIALETEYGPPAQLHLPLWHMWHPPAADQEKVPASSTSLLAEYKAARGDKTRVRDVTAAGARFILPRGRRPRVCIIADVPNWAWGAKARQIKQHLDDEFDIEIAYLRYEEKPDPIPSGCDIYHTFEVSQLERVRPLLPQSARLATGITAHVWQTWEERHGRGTVASWARGAAFHANSRMLQREMETLLERPVHYTPNGVDERFFRRDEDVRPDRLVVGFVGKPNPRKELHIIEAACKSASVELITLVRRSSNAAPPETVRDLYQKIHVLAVASDMDGTPNPALEAAACECAVVSNRIGNMPEFISHEENGLLVERDTESVAEALRKLAADPARAVAMGRAARQTVESAWTWRRMSRHYADMWREMLA